MKAMAYVSEQDSLEGIILPADLKKLMNIHIDDPLEVYVDEEILILKKCVARCVLCECTGDIIEYKGRNVCTDCIEKLKSRV
ncbi:MAG: AbrB/MazE/SpoVT family DNA-binding domain-containing protein [Clostridiales bacterium]|nr:AbrB/MazE/SpoVT family DNA-binding domain-containing protein [Clostridiales bacterium]